MIVCVTKEEEHFLHKGNVIVNFVSETCARCEYLTRYVDHLAKTNPSLVFASVNARLEPDLVFKFGIHELPSVVFLSNGHEKGRVTGVDEVALWNLVQRARQQL